MFVSHVKWKCSTISLLLGYEDSPQTDWPDCVNTVWHTKTVTLLR